MHIPDYDKALYYTLWGHWDDLFILMTRTEDDLLSKKIHQFLTAYHFSYDREKILRKHDELLYYVDHAMKNVSQEHIQV